MNAMLKFAAIVVSFATPVNAMLKFAAIVAAFPTFIALATVANWFIQADHGAPQATISGAD